jgi:hypothetical protein
VSLPAEAKEDMEFLLNFAPTVDPKLVIPGLMSFNYLTGTYEGDLKLVTRVKAIVDKYSLETPDGDLCDEN